MIKFTKDETAPPSESVSDLSRKHKLLNSNDEYAQRASKLQRTFSRLMDLDIEEQEEAWMQLPPSVRKGIINAFSETEIRIVESQLDSGSEEPYGPQPPDEDTPKEKSEECSSFNRKVEGTSPIFGAMWTYEVTVRWCWNSEEITFATHVPVVWTSIFSPWAFLGDISVVEDGGTGEPSYHVYRQGEMAICLPGIKAPCVTPRYPWVDITVDKNGNATGDAGGEGLGGDGPSTSSDVKYND